ncbi:hypothetical protein L2D01_04145 [Hyphomonadaceae bacterium ML37]|nr:hypothetical protein L2D01_04145 [Hyphomonadaceae bacterium ML37]
MSLTSIRSPILAALLLALSVGAPSSAQGGDAAPEDSLYEEVMALRSSGNLAEARALLTDACELGDDLWACAQAAPMWLLGDGGRADAAIAKHQYDGACALGNRAGCLAAELSETHRSASPSALSAAIGEGLFAEGQPLMADDNTQGLNFLGPACQLNHAQACVLYGRNLDPIPVFDSEGFDAACRGAVICTVQPAEFYSTQDDPEAGWAFARACDLGSGDGCFALGDFHDPTGLFGAPSTPENWRGAISAFQRACDEHQLADGCERYRRVMEHSRNTETAAVLAYREARCEAGDQPSCEFVSTERARMNAAAQGAPTLDPLLCAQALYLVSTDGPQHVARTTAEARAAVQAHIAAHGGDQLQLENQVVAAARMRLQALQSGAETPEAVRREVQACRRQFGFQP